MIHHAGYIYTDGIFMSPHSPLMLEPQVKCCREFIGELSICANIYPVDELVFSLCFRDLDAHKDLRRTE